MGIRINVTAKNDVSYLFQGMNASGGSMGNLNFLSDYASIKNGSYGKLMKAYYTKDARSEVKSTVNDTKKNNAAKTATSADSATTLAKVQKSTDTLKTSADKLLATGRKSVFTGDTVTDDAYNAVSQFVKDYNEVISAASDAKSSSISTRALSLESITSGSKSALEKVGITINKDNTLSIDKDTFMKADMNTVKSLFNTTGSYAYRASAQASLINFSASNEAAKANTYTAKGAYGNAYNSGDLFNSLF